ncbi:MAG: hypothetical protein L0216_10665 [Planctomycetales bacterium]|nr:hypothetical protein [Planctomycetales bacterium]
MSTHRMIGLGAAMALAMAGGGPASAQNGKGEGGREQEERVKLGQLDDALKARVNDCVSRGVEMLLGQQLPDGSWEDPCYTRAAHSGHGPFPHGVTSLVLYACLKGGANRFDERIEKGFKFLKDKWDGWKASGRVPHGPAAWKTYEVGITIMALEALGMWKPGKGVEQHGTAVVGGKLKKDELDWVKELRDYLIENVAFTRQETTGGAKAGVVEKREVWSYPSTARMITDHSNTQYAVLGLKSAARLGYPSPGPIWIGILENFLYTQEEAGPRVNRVLVAPRKPNDPYVPQMATQAGITDTARGWGYNGNIKPPAAGGGQQIATGSMTTVGVASMELAWSEIQRMAGQGDKDARGAQDKYARDYDRSVNDGLAWLALNFSVTENPKYPGNWHYYYLYGLERAGVLSDHTFIGKHDWYGEGAKYLVTAGPPWPAGSDGPVCANCYAILFLCRATIRVRGGITGHGPR